MGVYYKNQEYDFETANEFIEKEELTNFYLHELRGSLDKTRLFEENGLTEEMKFIFEILPEYSFSEVRIFHPPFTERRTPFL